MESLDNTIKGIEHCINTDVHVINVYIKKAYQTM